jgi:predicted membrane protein
VNSQTNFKPDRGPVIGGVVFIVVGTFLLLEKLGYLPSGLVLHFWPMIFVVIGLVKLACAGGRPMGAVLITVGLLLQLSEVGILHVHFWELWPVFIIVAGAAMLWQALGKEAPSFSGIPQFDAFYIFGGGDRQVSAKNFRGARLMAVFGGYKVDFRHADMEGTEAVLEANAIFGGGEIIVPEHWLVSLRGVSVFGGYEDKSRHFQPDATKPTKTLIVKGVAVFGGIEVKN